MATSTLPHWDLSDIYPALDSPEFEAGFRDLIERIEALERTFDEHNIEAGAARALNAEAVQTFEGILAQLNGALETLNTLRAYAMGFVATDSRDELAQAKLSALQRGAVRLAQLLTRWTGWVGARDVEALIARSEAAGAHAYALRKAKVESAHLMSPAEEALVAELDLSGGSAWAKLHGTFTSQLSVTLELEGARRQLPMSALRNLAHAPERATRKAAYEAELAAWEAHAVPVAAAFNGVKGQTLTLAQRRGWGDPLDAALHHNHIDRETLSALHTAVEEAFPDFRRYLKAKARALGLERLCWYDLFAPLGRGRAWSYDEAARFIQEQFGTFSEQMCALAERAFNQGWIDAEPRDGKRDGAFCMSVRPGESRVLANYEPTYSSMSTLAHELGHAYHNLNLAARAPLQRQTPMTLAETASIFCETVVQGAALERADEAERLSILESSLQRDGQVILDIASRFRFESAAFERRRARELSASELNALMREAQRATYGDALDQDALHPYMWAVKPHYYSADRSFYNFPYTFGRLFGLGLYARYREAPEGFQARYDELLSSTGLDDAAALAATFGIDIRQPDVWRASLDVIREDIDRFEGLV